MGAPERAPELEQLFVPHVVRAYRADADPQQIAGLYDEERVVIDPMAPRRQAEFATARACARAAMSDLGVAAPVPRREGGAPHWPAGVTGSISHTRGVCVGIASLDTVAIGIDIEEVARIKPSVERRILGDGERQALEGLTGIDRQLRVATIFAAKEAFYKAHYEVDPRYLGFDAVAIEERDETIAFAPGSGAVDEKLLAATTGRTLTDHGRVVVGVAIDVVALSAPLPSPA